VPEAGCHFFLLEGRASAGSVRLRMTHSLPIASSSVRADYSLSLMVKKL